MVFRLASTLAVFVVLAACSDDSDTSSSSSSSGGSSGTTEVSCDPPREVPNGRVVRCAPGCQTAGIDGKSFCTKACSSSQPCPSGFSCSPGLVCEPS